MSSALNTAAKRKKRAFTHWTAQATPPPGTYDPALLAQEQAGQRGLADFQADTARDTTRSSDDFIRSSNDVTRTRDQSLADIARNVTRENENFGTATSDLNRNYQNLGRSQAGGIFAAGAGGGGALAAAAAARHANQGRDQSGLDTTHDRAIADYGTQSTRTTDDATRQLGALTLGNQRQGEDSATALTRAVREQGALSQDSAASEWFSAAATGYSPPPKPSGEGHRGATYYRRNKDGTATLEDGRIVSAAGLRRILASAG